MNEQDSVSRKNLQQKWVSRRNLIRGAAGPMKKHTLLLLVAGLASLMIAGQVQVSANNNSQVRRVRLQASSGTFSLVIAAEGIERVGGAGTDLDPTTEGSFCDIHFNKVTVDEDGHTAVLEGKVVEASDPANYGAFVKITAHTNGKVNFVFQTLTGVGSTGAAGLDFTGGTVTIVVLQ